MQKDRNSTEAYFKSLQRGEEQGLLYFFNRYYATLVVFANSITKDEEVAKEITSEAFYKLWCKRHIISDGRSVKSYLYRTVSNASIDYLRQQKVNRKRQQLLHATSYGKEEKNVLHKMVEVELYHQLYKSLDSLPHRSRRIFQLFYFGNKSLQEIALELGTSVDAVKSRKKRAMQLLREQKDALLSLACLLVTLCH